MKVRNECRALEHGVRMGRPQQLKTGGGFWICVADHQHVGGWGMHVCSQPWVTAKSRAASRDAKALSKRKIRQ